MKTQTTLLTSSVGSLTVLLVAIGTSAWAADIPTLKAAFKDQFFVGAAINRTIAMGTVDQADDVNRTQEQVDKDIALVKAQFNQISPENDLKWARIHPRAGADGYDFGPADAYVNFGLSNNMYIVGHTLIWHNQTPNWVFAATNSPPAVANDAAGSSANKTASGTNARSLGSPGRRFGRGGFGFNGPRASRDELLRRMRDHIDTVVGRYKGKIKVWDVVNEAVADGGTDELRNSLWRQIIGPDFIAKAFQYAHEADPEAILRYNDYGLENPSKRRKLIALVKSLQEQHVPVMAIGSQTHVSASTPSFEAEDQALTELETLGLPIHITELDVNGARGGQNDIGAETANNAATTQGGLIDNANQRLAREYAALFRAFLKHRNSVKVVTFWGANDGVSWRANGRPLLFDAHDQPKPAFDAVIAEAQKATALLAGLPALAQTNDLILAAALKAAEPPAPETRAGAPAPAATAPAADFTGTWKSEFDSQIGHQTYTFTFKQDGTKLTGNASSEIGGRHREADLKEGKVDGDAISCVEMLNFQDNEIRITYAGKLSSDGNEIKFTREVGDFAKEDIVARREQNVSAAGPLVSKTIRIKAGRSERIKDAEGNVWLADQGFAGGETIERPEIKIANTKDPDLYRSEHYSMDSFSWPVTNGKYEVKLHFAETYEGITGPGERLFSFNVQGKEFKDFDVWVKAGGPMRAYVEAVPVEVTNGVIKVTFTPKVENPQICAIEIIPLGGAETGSKISTSQ